MAEPHPENPPRDDANTSKRPYGNQSQQHPRYSSNDTVKPTADIAICGIGLRLPGGIRNCDDYWNLLYNGLDARRPIPSNRYNIHGFDDSLGGKHPIKAKHGYFIDDDLTCLDTSFFPLTKSELGMVDPQHRLLLEVTRECLDDAGEVNYRENNIGCYVGTFGEDWLLMNTMEPLHAGGIQAITGFTDLVMANRISHEFDFRGPSMVVKTGCSASAVALHEACLAIRNGNATSAIVGGASILTTPSTSAPMFADEILAPDASCKTFDASADGYARAEGITAVYIKPLADALRDGNPVRAIIRATSINCDGKGVSLVTPNGYAHEALMRATYSSVGLDPKDTAFIECHATGTPTGDPIETTAVGKVFGEKGIFMTSVKANLGHSEGSAGLASVIKCVLALEHQIIPPNIKLVNPNPKIPFAKYNLAVPLRPTPFPEDRKRRVSINSFGIGGSNAHVILESYNPDDHGARRSKWPQLLLLSANTEKSIQKQIHSYWQWVEKHPEAVSNLAYTLGKHRQHLPHRASIIVNADKSTDSSTPTKVPRDAPSLVVVFSGQGAQWPGMAKELIENDDSFREDLHKMDQVLQKLEYPPPWKLIEELAKTAATTQIHKAALSQPLCTAIQLALFNKFSRLGLEPTAVVGHSSGEIAAAYAAGYISMGEAIVIAYYRGYVTTQQTSRGSMAAVGMGAQDASEFLVDNVVVACENSPDSCTISGDSEKVAEVIEAIKVKAPDVFVRLLKVDMAYHSYHMMPLVNDYLHLIESALPNLRSNTPSTKIDMFSTVFATKISPESAQHPSYWIRNLISPVKFSPSVSNLLSSHENCLFLEIGPHSTLAGPLRQICSSSSRPFQYTSALSRGKNSSAACLSAIGELYQQGFSLDLSLLFPSGRAISDLPTYSWDHSVSYWSESRISKAWRFRQYPQHCLLGERTFEGSETEPRWRNHLSTDDVPWLLDHKLRDDVIFPFAGYVAVAGEAVRQVTHSPRGAGYRLRHVVAHKALVLVDTVEISTSLRDYNLNDMDGSSWYEFTVSSYSGSSWSKHCTGQVRIIKTATPSEWTPELLPRHVDCSRIYNQLAHVGFVYGPSFRGMTSATSSTTSELAHAKITSIESQNRSHFTLHPATIDAGLQLLILSEARGLPRNVSELAVPTVIEEIEVNAGADVMHARSWRRHGVEPCVKVHASGNIAFRALGIEFRPLHDDVTSSDLLGVHGTARLNWLPHYDFVDASTLISPPVIDRAEQQLREELILCCALEASERIRHLEPGQPHFIKYRNWLNRQVESAAAGGFKLVRQPQNLLAASQEDRRSMINEFTSRLLLMPQKAVVIGLRRIFDNIEQIFTGKVDTLETLLQNNVLAQLYDVTPFDDSKFLRILSHTNPTIKILEVGAGTGGTTETAIRSLMKGQALPAYSTYTFTDISAGFFAAAKERFSYAPNIEFRVLDISQSPLDQGFKEEIYDLVIASNVLHATPSLRQTLSNVRMLLKPQGILLMKEICNVSLSTSFIFGLFSGWWLGEDDGRPDHPHAPVSRWDQDLKATGYSGVDVAVYDEEEPYRQCAIIVAKKEPHHVPQPSSVTILCQNHGCSFGSSTATALEAVGWKVTKRLFGDVVPEGEDIISTIDLEKSLLEDASQETFVAVQEFSRSLGSRRVLWLMPPTQVECSSPSSAQLLGLARTLRSEMGLNFYTLEIDGGEGQFGELISRVFDRISQDQDNESLEPDREYIVKDGVVSVGRYRPFSIPEQPLELSYSDDLMAKLRIEKPGMLATMEWVSDSLPEVVMPNQVEIEVRSAGMNFHDVVSGMGLIPSETKEIPLGVEISGTVTRIGTSVTAFSLGDRVMAMCHGGFSTHVTVDKDHLQKIPDGMSFEEAATFPCCFATVLYALLDAGRLRRGMSVLVHSACGGIGLAAMQIIQMVGGEIYATVGNEQKRNYLVKNFGIARSHIFNSRDDSFLDGVMSHTSGRGVDLVLNALSGELLHASWKCVAKFGTLLELGKRDLASFGKLDMGRFLDNRSYCGIDMKYLLHEQPFVVKDLLERLLSLYDQGLIRPLKPITPFDARDAKKAFRYMQDGQHIGKVVLNLPQDPSALGSKAVERKVRCDGLASYLFVGGLGGLGRALAIWLVERGAKNLVFLSRNVNSGGAFAAELESMGCSVTLVSGSVNKFEDVNEAVGKAPSPIKGVFHLAMVQRDAAFLDTTWTDWNDVNEPKVRGTWNLHRALKDQPIDYFWLASSAATVADQVGQASYKSGCTFTESFCQYRYSLGLPASVVSICGIEDTGYLAENPSALRSIRKQGLYTLREKEFLQVVEASLLNSMPGAPKSRFGDLVPGGWSNNGHIAMGLKSYLHLEDPKNPTNWRRDRRMGAYHNIPAGDASNAQTENTKLKIFLQNLTEGEGIDILAKQESIDFIAIEIGTKINDFLLKPDAPVDPSLKLSEMGLDSLTAIGLRRWFRQRQPAWVDQPPEFNARSTEMKVTANVDFHPTPGVIKNHAAEPPSIYQRGEFVALGSTSFVERLPNGDIIKTAWPGADRAAERRREIALESQIYDRLGQHPRIVKKIAWDPNNLTLTLEYMPNGTLKAYLESNLHVSLSQRLQWIIQAAEGLDLLHRSAIIHCDVGPHNYLLDHHLDLKIVDFAGSSRNHSATDTCPGVRYTSPHLDRTWYQCPGPQVDMFALGSTMYYILTGKAPFAEFDSEGVKERDHQRLLVAGVCISARGDGVGKEYMFWK
ncbi:hypothetical protein H9Q69_005899 [Fusarium xylarioides]|nr:hypothetical protein H9Q69_005899 [Fusarium xylarioides]